MIVTLETMLPILYKVLVAAYSLRVTIMFHGCFVCCSTAPSINTHTMGAADTSVERKAHMMVLTLTQHVDPRSTFRDQHLC